MGDTQAAPVSESAHGDESEVNERPDAEAAEGGEHQDAGDILPDVEAVQPKPAKDQAE